MPIYEYECGGCGEVFEAVQKMSDAPLKKHDKCGSKKVKKLISQSNFQLKGTGWYVTDYGKGTAGVKSNEPPQVKSDEAPAAKSEVKAEPKAEKIEKVEKVEKKPAKKDKPAA